MGLLAVRQAANPDREGSRAGTTDEQAFTKMRGSERWMRTSPPIGRKSPVPVAESRAAGVIVGVGPVRLTIRGHLWQAPSVNLQAGRLSPDLAKGRTHGTYLASEP